MRKIYYCLFLLLGSVVSFAQNPSLVPYYTAPGRILDFKYNKVFVVDDSTYSHPRIIDIGSHTTTVLPVKDTVGYEIAQLTPFGALFARTLSQLEFRDSVFDWNNGTIAMREQGRINDPYRSRTLLKTAGNYAIWNRFNDTMPDVGSLYLRNLFTKQNSFIAQPANEPDLAANGLVTYHGTFLVYKYQDGVKTIIIDARVGEYFTSPLTDGKQIIFKHIFDYASGPFGDSIYLYDGMVAGGLDGNNLDEEYPDFPISINNGYIAYTKRMYPDPEKQLWLRDTSGNSRRVTYWDTTDVSSRPHLVALNGKGDLVLHLTGDSAKQPLGYYYIRKDGPVKYISPYFPGQWFFEDDHWFVVKADSVFKLTDSIPCVKPEKPPHDKGWRIFVYPNPFNQQFTVAGLHISKHYLLTLYNPQGRVIQWQRVFNQSKVVITVDTRLTKGIYLLQVYDDDKKKVIRTLKLIHL